ncbi:MAG: FAD-dependent oxidoreductase, partial [Pseudomonadota bacterium]
VSGAHGGETVDFRRLAARGMTLLGMTDQYAGGEITFRPDLADNIRAGDENYLSVLTEADAYIEARALDYPSEPEAHVIDPDPECMTNPILSLDLAKEGVSTIIWATGYALDFSWLQVDAFDENGAPSHDKGVSKAEGVYFLGLPWLSMRGSSFIWGSWVDAERLAGHIADRA